MISIPRSLLELVGAGHCTVPQLLIARAERSPDQPFLFDGERTFSYGEVLERALGFARYLEMEGLAGQRIAAFLPNRSEAYWVWLGTLLGGGVFVAINSGHRGLILLDQIRRSRAQLLVVDTELGAHLASDLGMRTIDVDAPRVAGQLFARADRMAVAPLRQQSPADVASIIFTSGTTGRAKAVQVPHNALCRGGARIAESFGLRPTDICHSWASLAHIGGQLDVAMSAMVSGGALALFRRFSASSFWDEVGRYRTTYFAGFANVLYILLARSDVPGAATSLRFALIAGAPMSKLRELEERLHIYTVNTYGMTEAEAVTLRGVEEREARDTVGRVNPDFELAIFDDEHRLLPLGSSGRIAIRPLVPDVVMRGYDDDHDAASRIWREGWLQTADHGWLDANGFVHYAGRDVHLIRRRGENISATELTAVVLSHEAIHECAAIGVASDLGEQDVKLAVVPKPGHTIDGPGLLEFLRSRLAAFMLPRYIEIRADLPYSEVGKLRQDALMSTENAWDAESVRVTTQR